MPKSQTTVQIRPDSSTPGILGAHAHLLERLAELAPEPLNPRLHADEDDLEERGANLENAIKAFQDYVGAFLQDTAAHTWAVHVDRKWIDGTFHDLIGDTAGAVLRGARTLGDERANQAA